ncbi:MAG: hypothetical protein JXJ20_09940 [Anaerolineae bacterium]|nr:hypothetical protein [Anaerolineae bacterium]
MKGTRLSISLAVAALVLGAAAIAALALPVAAAPGAQNNIPTPTPAPMEDVAYTLEVVGGEEQTLTFPGAESDGLTIGETSVTSTYPRGMIFSMQAASDNGEIQDVILFMEYVHGTRDRVNAEYDRESDTWIAHPWDTGEGRPAWSRFNFYWRVRDSAGVTVETDPQLIDYADPTRPWFRAESEHMVLYWFGFGEDMADEIAQTAAYAVESTHQRRMDGFGGEISYKPIAVVYPQRDILTEMYANPIASETFAGYTSSDLGMSVQVLHDGSTPPGNEECIWSTPEEERTMEWRIERIYHTTTHEFTHLWQYDVLGGAFGKLWWFEGQAEWFGFAPGQYDKRLRKLAELQDIPSLTEDIGANLTQADGCYALAYDVGPSFINFLHTNYGGIETLQQIAQGTRYGTSMYESVEEIAGKPFIEVENEWRTYLGFEPLSLADVDPASALEPAIAPIAEIGETVLLPSTPPIAYIYEKPGPNVLSNGQCFSGMEVTILDMGSLDGIDYYQVDCMGMVGWMSRDQLVGP